MRYWLLCGKLKVIENLAYVYHIGGKTMGIKTSNFEKIMRDAIRVISDLSNCLEKAEKERDDALELIHSYRHICGETPPERLRELVQADHEGRYIIMRDAERNGVARLKELSEADREGRCVVLPGKPGEMVRFIGNPSAKPEVVDAISVYADGRITYNFHTTGMMTRYVDEWSEDDAYKYCSVNGTMKESENDG